MNKRIVWTRPDGGVSVCCPAINLGESLTEDEAVARALSRRKPDGTIVSDVPADATNVAVVDVSVVDALAPQKKPFRNAWVWNGTALSVDMPKARVIWRQEMRRKRAERWPLWDAEYLKADEAGDATRKAELAAKRQQLRDVTAHPGIGAATTPDELRAVWPAILEDTP